MYLQPRRNHLMALCSLCFKKRKMRTTIIFLGLCLFGIAGIIMVSTKKGREWMKKFD